MTRNSETLKYSIVSIATNKYSKYLLKLLQSSSVLGTNQSQIEWVIFTDAPDLYEGIRDELNFKMKLVQIPNFGWPEATLFRYKIIHDNFANFSGDYLVYLDADMEITGNFLESIDPQNWNNGFAFVSHPGYWRPGQPGRRAKLYLENPTLLMRDFYRVIRYGSLGAWERNRTSTAYTPRRLRATYVCGGTWMGTRSAIRHLVTELSQRVEEDQRNGVMACWHDESHLNKWSATNSFTLLTPRYCYDPSYPALKSLSPLIKAIDKRIE